VHRSTAARAANSSWCTFWVQPSDRAAAPEPSECSANLSAAGLGGAAGRTPPSRSAPSGLPRAAICLTGHARTFTRPHVHDSIRRNLVDALGVASDVFGVFALRDAGMKMQRGWNHMPTDVSSLAHMAIPLQRVGVRVASFETATGRLVFNGRCKLNNRNIPDAYVTRLVDQVRTRCGWCSLSICISPSVYLTHPPGELHPYYGDTRG